MRLTSTARFLCPEYTKIRERCVSKFLSEFSNLAAGGRNSSRVVSIHFAIMGGVPDYPPIWAAFRPN